MQNAYECIINNMMLKRWGIHMRTSLNILKVVRILLILIMVVICTILVTSRFTNIGILKFFILLFAFSFLLYFLFPLISYIEQRRYYNNRGLLHITFIFQGGFFFFSIYSFASLLELEYKHVNFWVGSFFTCVSLVILIDLARKIYQNKKLSKFKTNGSLSIYVLHLIYILFFIIWCFEKPYTRELSNIKIPNSISASIIQNHFSTSEILNSFHTMEETVLISQLIEQIRLKKVNNLDYLKNFKYYLDLNLAEKHYLYVFHYEDEINIESQIDSIVILPNHDVFIEEGKPFNIFKDPYLRYKINISETLVDQLIKYAY
jgi:hypothetical protein